MKKFLIATIAVLGFTTANAQHTPEKGTVITEVQFNPFSQNYNTFKLNDGAFKVRYFFNENNALRVKLGFGINNDNTTEVESYNNTSNPDNGGNIRISNETTEKKNKETNFQIALGYENHFFNSGRFDVYAGAEIGYKLTSYSGEKITDINSNTTNVTGGITTITNIISTETITYNGQNTKGNTNNHEFSIAAFTGVDFYLYKGLYIGTELGIKFATGKTASNPSYTEVFNETKTVSITNQPITTTITNVSYDSSTGVRTTNISENGVPKTPEVSTKSIKERNDSYTNLKFYIEPAIRIGWRF